jgi:hypothetical protein
VMSPGPPVSPGRQVASPSHQHLNTHGHMGYQQQPLCPNGMLPSPQGGLIPQMPGQVCSRTSQLYLWLRTVLVSLFLYIFYLYWSFVSQ